jgi:spore maturation protein SpmB
VQHTAKFESWLVLVVMVSIVMFVGEGLMDCLCDICSWVWESS